MIESFKEIRHRFPEKFLLLEGYQEIELSARQVEVIGAESATAFDSLREVYDAYRSLKSQGRRVVFCTPKYSERFIMERQPSARVLG